MSKTKEHIKNLPTLDSRAIDLAFAESYETFNHQIVVLDDDPTGVQTVHGVSVYTDWDKKTIEKGFKEENQLFFILTNSRSFSEQKTERVHRVIAQRVKEISEELGKPFLLISRGDSTLRGHYPLETAVMNQELGGTDGEVILPFFEQGGRLTIQNTHYVEQGEQLIPAGETEFALDRTFGFDASDLTQWVEEKTSGQFKAEDVVTISLDTIRAFDLDKIEKQLLGVEGFNKIVVNAVEEQDVKIFSIALIRALKKGKRFIYRTAATFTKIIGNISSRELLTRDELIQQDLQHGGLVVIGSHVQKTTEQLEELMTLSTLRYIEFDCHLVLDENRFAIEVDRVKKEAEQAISSGTTAVIYTRRERLDLGDGMKEEELALSVVISKALTDIVRRLEVQPNYVIAKGGITSSDVGTNGLQVKRALVKGQVAPGIPVWETDEGSTFPHIPYVIFPGNVGQADTLKNVVQLVEQKQGN
ncbi:hydroxyacid dehydrogenase [Jeotgalibacillus sp. S-D1]|uniref:four-carbon acid sugar kinase family protein n=1 Tax=Jeotgalibacillus sp. S-D1 TaxID=2552189 RepID=UPI00105AA4EB|nr:four-carbon acid sugar kinase family protein [Jeotgalibacillus sp. S-D1]TDL32928.1 hydroxyacid dehydrogenase [Jeotgalibacillus sp. S-D1]